MELFVRPEFWRPSPRLSPEGPLAEPLRVLLASSWGSFLDPDRLQALAEDLGCAQRHRELHSGMLIIALILSALQQGADTQGRWLDAHAICQRLGGGSVKPSALGERIRALEPVFHVLLRRRVLQLAEKSRGLKGRLRDFADVIIPDGCAFKIAAALAGVSPGTSNPAEFKLHAVYSVGANGLINAATSAGTTHDNDGFKPAKWIRNALYIWDLGFHDYDRFVEAVREGAIPLQRLKDKANPVVLAWYDADGTRHALVDEKGLPVRLEAACVANLLPLDGPLDLDVLIRDEKRNQITARVVCVPFEGEDRWYLTTLPRTRFTPHDVAELYRIRWEVELFFRTLRGAARLDDVRRMRNPAAVNVAILSSMIAATLGQELTLAINAWESAEIEPAAEFEPAEFEPVAEAEPVETSQPPPVRLTQAQPARCRDAPHGASFSPCAADDRMLFRGYRGSA